MEVIRHLARAALIVVAVCAAIPSLVSAAWKDLVPKPYENGADLEVFASYETDSNRTDGRGLDWTDTFIKEKITLYSNGYIYHPRFIAYLLSLSGALKHEDFDSSFAESTGWRTAEGTEYDATLDVLPEHPYGLKLFSRRIEPLFKEQFATQSNNVGDSRGAVFRYRKKPYFFHARYIEDSIESSLNTSDVTTWGADGAYFKQYANGNLFSLDGVFTRKEFDSSAQGPGDATEYSLGNTIGLRFVTLGSSLSETEFHQDSPLGVAVENDQFAWSERLGAKLPLNFRTDLSYELRRTTFTTGATETSPESSIRTTDKRTELGVSHTLYQSLSSNYTFRRDDLSSTGGDTNSTSHSLSASYTKKIPWGRLLAGLSLSKTVTDTSGQATIINELHAAIPVPGAFVINSQTADPATISVFLRSPLPPFELVFLGENVHFTVAPFGNTFQITILNLPPQFVVPGTFDFLVSYSVIPAEFEIQTDGVAYNVGFDLFHNMVNPYYSYSSTRSKVLSGIFPAVSPDSELHTAGVILQKEPFRARAEYQYEDSNVRPYSQWKGELTFTKNITDTLRAYASSSYTETSYPQGTSALGGQGYDVRYAAVSANFQKRFPIENLLLSAGGTYSFFRGLTDGSTYSVNSALLWRVGKIDVSLGASATSSESESPGTIGLEAKRTHQYYYLNVKRKLF